ncbi:uncharacterized protein [Antedon mediterranea]|uniref:uncharacterized protein n=1 Tax=Antedon mediterranea TaxID=105859 RepID=UPI003AF5CF41
MTGLRTVLLLLAVVCLSQATHFRGGTFRWRPSRTRGQIEISWRVSWRRSYAPRNDFWCEYPGQHLGGEGDILCVECRRRIYRQLDFNCTDFSDHNIEDWSTGVGSFLYTPDREVFTIRYEEESTSYWIYLQNYGDANYWNMISTIDLRPRPDTRLPNSSPYTTVIPIIRVQQGCSSKIRIPVSDPDYDTVRCRWTNEQRRECPPNQFDHSVCGSLTEESTLDSDECEIYFPATAEPGWYAVSMMIEDFATPTSTKALSTIPLQFLIKVFPLDEPCRQPEIFEPPGTCFYLKPNKPWSIDVKARSGRRGVGIVEIGTASPAGMTKSPVKRVSRSRNDYAITLRWIPRETGIHFVCLYARDTYGVTSDQRCLRLIVAASPASRIAPQPPKIVPRKSYPSPLQHVVPENNEWVISFDKPIKRPNEPTYIEIINPTKPVPPIFRIDAASESVTFNETSLSFKTPGMLLKDNALHMISVDPGIARVRNPDPCAARTDTQQSGWMFRTNSSLIPREPVVECHDSHMTVYIHRSILADVSSRRLHLHDPICRGRDLNETHVILQTGYNECGTVIRAKSDNIAMYRNTIRDRPRSEKGASKITRDVRHLEIKVICEMESEGLTHGHFLPKMAKKTYVAKSEGRSNFTFQMFDAPDYSRRVSLNEYPAQVAMRQRMYFSAKARDPSKRILIETCKATPTSVPGSRANQLFEFVKDGCLVDSTMKTEYSPSISEQRFSMESFSFMFHGLHGEVFLSCQVLICDPTERFSRCSQGCSSDVRGKRAASDISAEMVLPLEL